jgi:ABC-type molybdenum transport system ATPase subunit/photorepair protein PhrA
LQEEDKLPLREKLIAFFDNQDQAGKNVDSALTRVELNHMKDIPAIALSSGQTRRMRIALALMTNPNLLILEDPMAGLDAVSRITVSELLSDVNATQDNPRVVLVLRGKGDETLADWVTNVCEVQNGNVWIGTKEEWETRQRKQSSPLNGKKAAGEFPSPTAASGNSEPPIARLRNVSVTYGEGERRVLDGVDWTIRPGDRWHLKGSNGEWHLKCVVLTDL